MHARPSTLTRTTTTAFLLLSVGGLALGGCGSGRRVVSTSASAAPVSSSARFPALDEGWREAGYRLDWVGYPFITNTGVNQVQEFAASGGTVVALDKRGIVSMLDGSSGQTRWSTQLATPLTRFVGLTIDPTDAGRVVASSETEAFLLSGQTGALVARERFGKVATTAPVMTGSNLTYGTSTGEVFTHRLGTGLQAWAFLAVGTIESDPVRLSSSVGLVTQAGDVVFIDPSSGSLVGRGRTFGPQASDPIVVGDAMVLASTDQSVWCFEQSGRVRWRHRTSSRLNTAPGHAQVAGGLVIVDVPGDGLTALDVGSGEVKWRKPDLGGSLVGVRSGNLLVHQGDALHVVQPGGGRLVRTIPLEGIVRIVADKPVDGTLYAITGTNLVGKLTPR